MLLQLLVRHQHLEAILDVIECGRGAFTRVFEQDHVPAELGLHRFFGVAAFFQLDEDIGERLNHLGGGEPAKFPAFGCGGVGRLLLGQGTEVAALVELVDDLFGLFPRLDENMPGFVFGTGFADFLVIDLP